MTSTRQAAIRGRRAIQCTPPTDGAFLETVTDAYEDVSADVVDELPLVVSTLVAIRRRYPVAVITLLAEPSADEEDDCFVWLVARDGWGEAPSAPRRRGHPES